MQTAYIGLHEWVMNSVFYEITFCIVRLNKLPLMLFLEAINIQGACFTFYLYLIKSYRLRFY